MRVRNVLNMPRERADIKVTFFLPADNSCFCRRHHNDETETTERERYVEGNHPEDRSVCAWLPEHPAESREESSPAAP